MLAVVIGITGYLMFNWGKSVQKVASKRDAWIAQVAKEFPKIRVIGAKVTAVDLDCLGLIRPIQHSQYSHELLWGGSLEVQAAMGRINADDPNAHIALNVVNVFDRQDVVDYLAGRRVAQ